MQDIHSIGGARIFGGGDRRLRPLHHQNHQALKCPRCDSLNTKFCYYNNYNLSQPRHFCKNCRRYWTKGGVLRNVPVGGGCRKTKRNSKPKPGSDLSQQQHGKERKTTTNNNNNVNNNNNNNNNNSNSSASDSSSSLTVTNNTNVETVSVHSSSGSVSNVFGFTTGCTGEDNNGGFNQLEQGQDCGNIFPEIGSFTSLIASSSNEPLHFGFNNFLNINPSLHDDNHVHQQWHQHVNHDHRPAKLVNCGSVGAQENLKSVQGTTDALMDQTAQIGFSGLHDDRSVGHNSNGDFGPLDWQDTAGDDRGLFDLTSAVDHSSYWSQTTTTHEWSDHQGHPNLYLP